MTKPKAKPAKWIVSEIHLKLDGTSLGFAIHRNNGRAPKKNSLRYDDPVKAQKIADRRNRMEAKPPAPPKASPRRWVRTTTVAIHDKDHEEDEPLSRCWVCDVKPDKGTDRWAHRIIVNAPTDAECQKRADIIAEALNKGETNA